MDRNSDSRMVRFSARQGAESGGQEVFRGSCNPEDLPRVIDLIKDCAYMPEVSPESKVADEMSDFQIPGWPLVLLIPEERAVPITGCSLIAKTRVRLYSVYPHFFDIEVDEPEALFKQMDDFGPPVQVLLRGQRTALRELREEDGYAFSKYQMLLPVEVLFALTQSHDKWSFMDAYDIPTSERHFSAPVESLEVMFQPDSDVSTTILYTSAGRLYLREEGDWEPCGLLPGKLRLADRFPVWPKHAETLVERIDGGGFISRNLMEALVAKGPLD